MFAPLRRRANGQHRRVRRAPAQRPRAAAGRLRGEEPPAGVTSWRSLRESVRGRIRWRRRVSQLADLRTAAQVHVRRVAGSASHEWQDGNDGRPEVRRIRCDAGGRATPRWSGVPVDSVAMGGSVSAVLGLVAAAIPDGSRVATLSGEFTSTTFPFAAQAVRGVTITELDSDELVTTASDYDVVTASLVQSANGAVLDVDALRANVAGTDTLTVIDVTQAVGWKRRRPGVGRRHRRGGLQVAARAAGHRVDVVERPGVARDDPARRQLVRGRGAVVDDLRAAAAAGRRCPPVRHVADVVQRAGLGSDAAVAGVAGPRRDRGAFAGLASRLRAELQLPQRGFGDRLDPDGELPTSCMRAGIRASIRAGAVRVGFHLYNTDDDLDRLVDVLR